MANLFRIGGCVSYSEENPRVEGTAYSHAGNVVWVGSFGCFAELLLKESDRKIKILFYNNKNIPIKVRTYKGNEETLVDSFGENTDYNTPIEKIYDLSANTKIKFGTDVASTYGDFDMRMEYKIW